MYRLNADWLKGGPNDYSRVHHEEEEMQKKRNAAGVPVTTLDIKTEVFVQSALQYMRMDQHHHKHGKE